MKIEMSEQDSKILGVFLGRVSLTGAEVAEFNRLVQVLHTPVDEKPAPKEK